MGTCPTYDALLSRCWLTSHSLKKKQPKTSAGHITGAPTTNTDARCTPSHRNHKPFTRGRKGKKPITQILHAHALFLYVCMACSHVFHLQMLNLTIDIGGLCNFANTTDHEPNTQCAPVPTPRKRVTERTGESKRRRNASTTRSRCRGSARNQHRTICERLGGGHKTMVAETPTGRAAPAGRAAAILNCMLCTWSNGCHSLMPVSKLQHPTHLVSCLMASVHGDDRS